jgi:murein DD-endopeptidase MepM/ murein hydrolase activator NlpD
MKKFARIIYISFFVLFAFQGWAQVEEEPDTTNIYEIDENEYESEADEYDSLIIENSGPYWDFLRPYSFVFDISYAPARQFYNIWDTVTINPYKQQMREMDDTVLISLIDDGCGFHPPAIGDLTSNFGFRRWGRRAKFHFGVDVKMEVGDPVYATFEGVIRVAKKSADYGYMVLIRHNNGLETLCAHFSQLLVFSGQPVKAGDIIGLAGSTGRSTGPHLHFEVRFKGEKIDPNLLVHFPSGSLFNDTLQIDKSCFKHLYEVQAAKLKAKYAKTKIKSIKAKKGDTLTKIANRYGISVKKLVKINGYGKNTKLKKGRRIRLK